MAASSTPSCLARSCMHSEPRRVRTGHGLSFTTSTVAQTDRAAFETACLHRHHTLALAFAGAQSMLQQHLIQKVLNHKMSLYIQLQLQLQHRICKPLM